ncbi:MAG: alpha/beta fold hydrolase [Rhizobacter sp.]|nr:alpha/beta fold hydrolase [Burkholderiales bacterium]
MKVTSNGGEFEVVINEPAGVKVTPDTPTVLLIMGLGMQLIAWPIDFVNALTHAGYRVVRLDNRDIGLSHKTSAAMPSLVWMALRHRVRLPVTAAYTLRDMVEDTGGVLEALNISRCHVIGVSMGGMIAQGLASHHPDRVASLTSIMSTTGARGLPQATPKAAMALLSRPKSKLRDDIITHFVRVLGIIGSPKFPMPEADVRQRIGEAFDRSFYPAGTIKQMAAIMASGDRSDEVRRISVPTLVIHGNADPLVPLQNGADTANKVEDSEYTVIDGMGHDLGALAAVTERVLLFLQKHTRPRESSTFDASLREKP